MIDGMDYAQACREAINTHWARLELDAMIGPGNALPALKHGTAMDLFLSAMYMMMYNVLDYPAGTVPITFVREDELDYNTKFNDKIEDHAKKTMEG